MPERRKSNATDFSLSNSSVLEKKIKCKSCKDDQKDYFDENTRYESDYNYSYYNKTNQENDTIVVHNFIINAIYLILSFLPIARYGTPDDRIPVTSSSSMSS